jgi:hypothetical protein
MGSCAWGVLMQAVVTLQVWGWWQHPLVALIAVAAC